MPGFPPTKKQLFFIGFILLLCMAALPSHAWAAALPDTPEDIPWKLSALIVTFDTEKEIYIAEEDVVIEGGKTRLEADYVEFNNRTKDAFAQGNVLLISGEDSIACNAMEINLATETGMIRKGTIFIQKNNFYINGENIRKTGKFTYSAESGSITSCPGDVPDWKITGKNVRVTVEGYGFAEHATLWARSVPTLYTPFLSFPVKLKRQTGFLTPRISSSDRLGVEYEQPFYWAISRNTDATFYVDYMTQRGPKFAGEYRYALDDESKGFMAFDFLEDDKIDDGTSATDDYRFKSTPRRTNTDRYWFRMKANHALPNDFHAKLDLDLVSDADYLQEFTDGYTGYNDISHYFQTQYGRDLDEYDETVRKNSLVIDKSWTNHAFAAKAVWYDDVVARRQDTTDTTLQTLPGFEFSGSRQQVGATGLYYTFDTELRSFYRQDTTSTDVKGQRADVYPKFYLPLKFGKGFYFQPFLGARGTAYNTEDYIDNKGDDEDVRTRGLFDAGADFLFQLNRVFDTHNAFADKIQHRVVPKLSYRFLPNVIQDDLPYFDSLDSIGEENKLTWSLANSFISRNTLHDENGSPVRHYREFAWIKLYQDFDIGYERDGDDAQDDPWGDLNLEAEFNPGSVISLDSDLAFNPNNSHFTKLNAGVAVRDQRGDSIYTAYRYTVENAESWYTRFIAKLTDSVSAYYSVEMSLTGNKSNTIESKAGVVVSKACWGLGVEYKEESSDKQITFMITLRGIGEFGTK